MTSGTSPDRTRTHQPPVLLVWIDSRDAFVVRWRDGAAAIEGIASDVPPHHRSTGHVRHDPRVRHGGGGRPQTAGEPERLEHLARFLDDVAARVAADEDVLILGPETVRERLAEQLRDDDVRQRRTREVRSERSARMTEPQLVARVRGANRASAPRRA